jgi:hypothetical protein
MTWPASLAETAPECTRFIASQPHVHIVGDYVDRLANPMLGCYTAGIT